MIICAALKIKGTDTVIGCIRHGDGYSTLHDLNPKLTIDDVEEGFLTSKNEFLNRERAFWEAAQNGQLSTTTIIHKNERLERKLYSEDLY